MLSCSRICFLILCLDLCFSSSEVLEDENDNGEANFPSTFKDLVNRIKELEEFNEKLLYKIDQVEQQTKVNNLIFRNVYERKNENQYLIMKKVLHILNKVMKVRTKAEDISFAVRVDGDNATEVRPILVKFTNFGTKTRILSARNKLKTTKYEISADYSELVNKKRKELLPFLVEKRAQGHNAFIYYDKLMVDGIRVSLEDLKAEQKHEEEVKTEEEKPKVDPEMEVPTTVTADTDEECEDVGSFWHPDQEYEEY